MSRAAIPADLRRRVIERAFGQCEYCLTSNSVTLVPHEIDHIIAEKHGGATEAENLALACSLCNRHKGSDIASIDPESGELTPLFHPRRDRWSDHFKLEGAIFVPRSAGGRVTVRLLQLNRPERVTERELLLEAGALRLPG